MLFGFFRPDTPPLAHHFIECDCSITILLLAIDCEKAGSIMEQISHPDQCEDCGSAITFRHAEIVDVGEDIIQYRTAKATPLGQIVRKRAARDGRN